jgi:hypothetical protein
MTRSENHRALRFVLIFVGTLLAAFGVLLTTPAQYLDARLSLALVKVAHGALLACGSHATSDAAILRAPNGFAVEMRDGCNGINVTILLWSAILAFPARWRMKAFGLVAGPKPTLETIFEVSLVGDERRWRVTGRRALLLG